MITLTSEHLLGFRQALLMAVDILERVLKMHPRTAELRKIVKELKT